MNHRRIPVRECGRQRCGLPATPGASPGHGSTVLLTTDNPSLVAVVDGAVASVAGLRLETVATVAEAGPRLRQDDVALVLAHADGDGATAAVAGLVRAAAAAAHPVATVVVSEEYRAEQAVALLRQGAADYLARPFEPRRLVHLLDVLTVRTHLKTPEPGRGATVARLGEGEPFLFLPSGPVGWMMEQVRRVAPQQTTVLLGGETGTGKTRLARVIHELSLRRAAPFLTLNCGALPANLAESELFGHVRGAFTGADRDRVGKFAQAGRGTLLLDEIDALPPGLQVKLLRAVDERVIEPVGSDRSVPVQARLVVASNRDLGREVSAGRFRSDLYYRLNVVAFHLPPLREGRELIPSLAYHFLADFAARNGRPVPGMAADVLEALRGYDWPGNVRELRNVIERAVALCPGAEVRLDDLPPSVSAARRAARAGQAPAGTLARTKEEAEAAHILEVLQRQGNNRLRAAAELGISRSSLYLKLRRYGLLGQKGGGPALQPPLLVLREAEG